MVVVLGSGDDCEGCVAFAGSFRPSFGSMVRNGNFELSATPNCERGFLDEFPSVLAMRWLAGIIESYSI